MLNGSKMHFSPALQMFPLPKVQLLPLSQFPLFFWYSLDITSAEDVQPEHIYNSIMAMEFFGNVYLSAGQH